MDLTVCGSLWWSLKLFLCQRTSHPTSTRKQAWIQMLQKKKKMIKDQECTPGQVGSSSALLSPGRPRPDRVQQLCLSPRRITIDWRALTLGTEGWFNSVTFVSLRHDECEMTCKSFLANNSSSFSTTTHSGSAIKLKLHNSLSLCGIWESSLDQLWFDDVRRCHPWHTLVPKSLSCVCFVCVCVSRVCVLYALVCLVCVFCMCLCVLYARCVSCICVSACVHFACVLYVCVCISQVRLLCMCVSYVLCVLCLVCVRAYVFYVCMSLRVRLCLACACVL